MKLGCVLYTHASYMPSNTVINKDDCYVVPHEKYLYGHLPSMLENHLSKTNKICLALGKYEDH